MQMVVLAQNNKYIYPSKANCPVNLLGGPSCPARRGTEDLWDYKRGLILPQKG